MTDRKARPILFSTVMMCELLDGNKTQTRRCIRNPNDGVTTSINHGDGWAEAWARYEETGSEWVPRISPYGKPGDLLWVRETFTRNGLKEGEKVFYRTDGVSQFMGEMRESNGNITRYYTDHWERNGEKRKGSDWKPSIFMPRWASRLTLEITDVRVQRLLDISEEDAAAEGIPPMLAGDRTPCPARYIDGYRQIWEAINGKGSWKKNPWVWALTFKVHQKNVDDRLFELSYC